MTTLAQVNLLEVNDLTKVNIDSYSDVQLSAFYNRAINSQIPEEEIYRMVKQKGLPDAEINKLRSRIGLLKSSKTGSSDNAVADVQDARNYDSTRNQVREEGINRDLTIFGSELFTKNSLVFEPNISIATPSSYTFGPGDEVIISVYGFSEKKYNLEINTEGEIYIPSVGPIFLNGLSVEEATQKIRAKLASTIYRAINSGQTKVQVSLGKIRSIRITVIGQANKPGTFTVSSLTTLYNLLYLCGGPNNMGSFRSIELIRGNEVNRRADLYAFLTQGNQKDNILLKEGDIVRIPYYENRVKLSGDVKRPGIYELLESETFANLLQYSGGFNDFAYKAAVSVIRITDKEKTIIDLVSSDFPTFKSNSGDEYSVGRLQDKIANKIFISGSVLRPGNYELSPGLSLQALIEKAGGTREDAYTNRVSIFRYNKNKMPSIVSVNLDSAIRNNVTTLLQSDDSVSVYSIFDFEDNSFVNIEGNVRKPGVVRWRQNLSLKDVLLTTGGITDLGDSSSIEISRKIKATTGSLLNYKETETIMVSLSNFDKANDVMLQPYDIVMVKNLPGIINQRSVMVLGDVKIPGKYSLQKSTDKISDIIERVDGFRASADSNNITIRRLRSSNLNTAEREELFQRLLNIDTDSLASNQRLRNEVYKNYDLISVDLRAAMEKPNGVSNLALEDGDILTVQKRSNLVKVSGEVYYPTIVPYIKDKNAKYYINQAGSFMPSARKSGALVIYPDGKAKSVKTFLFFKSYPEVTARSEVFIPQKTKSNRGKLGVGELALLVSALGIVANVIITSVK